jgi:Branched-chain amino acid ABC-type transport system, permease components
MEGHTEAKNAVALAIMILILLFRPQGIFGQKERNFHEIICKMGSNYISYDFFYLFSICSKRGRPIENTF